MEIAFLAANYRISVPCIARQQACQLCTELSHYIHFSVLWIINRIKILLSDSREN